MDELVTILAGLLFWRIVITTCIGIAVSLLLNSLIPTFGTGAFLLFSIGGFAAGLVWETLATSPVENGRHEETQVSTPVIYLGLVGVGWGWGQILELATGSYWLSFALVAASPFVLGPIAGAVASRPAYLKHLLAAAVALAIGFAFPALVEVVFSG